MSAIGSRARLLSSPEPSQAGVHPQVTTRRERSALRARALADDVDMLVLGSLARHRVLTTHQLALVLDRAQGTVEWRMRRLRAAGLVDCTRPSRPAGTAPLHWWLTAAGRRATGDESAARDPEAPNVLFLAHTTAVAGLALALTRSRRMPLVEWRREEGAWEQWRITEPSYWSGFVVGDVWKLRPDALAVLEVGDAEVHAFVEVDRAP